MCSILGFRTTSRAGRNHLNYEQNIKYLKVEVVMLMLVWVKMVMLMLKMIVNDSDRHAVSPSLAVRPRLSQDQQR